MLWGFYRSDSFEEGVLKVVNLGDDADSTGAVFGQLAGAFYGVDAIPIEWRDKLAMLDKIEALASDLHASALRPMTQ